MFGNGQLFPPIHEKGANNYFFILTAHPLLLFSWDADFPDHWTQLNTMLLLSWKETTLSILVDYVRLVHFQG